MPIPFKKSLGPERITKILEAQINEICGDIEKVIVIGDDGP